MKNYILPLIILLSFTACTIEKDETNSVEGYKPVYISAEEAFLVEARSPTTFLSPGKMFLYDHYIYVTDFGSGVHIIDNSIPTNPKKVAFISIPGVRDAVVKDGFLLADNFTDLVSVDISNISNIQFKKRIKDIYPKENQFYPEFATGYFECVDPKKGYVLKWEKTTLNNPKCYR